MSVRLAMYCVSIHTCRPKISINVIDSTKLEQNTWNIASSIYFCLLWPHLHTFRYLLNYRTTTRSACFRSQIYSRQRDVNFCRQCFMLFSWNTWSGSEAWSSDLRIWHYYFPVHCFCIYKAKECNFFFEIEHLLCKQMLCKQTKIGYDIIWHLLRKISLYNIWGTHWHEYFYLSHVYLSKLIWVIDL